MSPKAHVQTAFGHRPAAQTKAAIEWRLGNSFYNLVDEHLTGGGQRLSACAVTFSGVTVCSTA
jgi:hypothetical protein